MNHCRLFNANSSLYIFICYIWFGLVGLYATSNSAGNLKPISFYNFRLDIYDMVGFHGISTIVGYLMLNPIYSYILDIYLPAIDLMSREFTNGPGDQGSVPGRFIPKT